MNLLVKFVTNGLAYSLILSNQVYVLIYVVKEGEVKPRLTSTAVFFTGIGLFFTGLSFLVFGTSGISFATPLQQIEPFTDTDCLACHTDEQRLKELAPAKEEEEAESLSSGPG